MGLGVLMEKDNTVRRAGGFIIQLMPFAPDEVIDTLEENLKKIQPVTTMLDAGDTPEQILERLLGNLDLQINEKTDTSFYCNCDRARVEKALLSIGKAEIRSMIEDGKPVTLNCHFCNKDYTFSIEELKELIK